MEHLSRFHVGTKKCISDEHDLRHYSMLSNRTYSALRQYLMLQDNTKSIDIVTTGSPQTRSPANIFIKTQHQIVGSQGP